MSPARSGHTARSLFLRQGGWILLAASLLTAAVLGARLEGNPADAAARGASLAPLLLLGVDVWGLGIALLRNRECAPLRIVLRAPAVLSICHLLAWFWARHLASFDVLYRLEALGDGAGIYVVAWGPAALLATLSAGSILAAVMLRHLVFRASASEQIGRESVTE